MVTRRKNLKSSGLAYFAILVILLCSCGREPVKPSGQEELPIASSQIRTAGGLVLSVTKLQEVYDGLTRDIARALQDPSIRLVVYNALHGSPYPEHKLHFRSFLAGDGRALLTKVAILRKTAPTAMYATLDSLIDLEFYMPVKEHWDRWDGGADLLVVNDLSDDDDVLPGLFDLAGNRLDNVSESQPPATPTLSLVRTETDFSKPPTLSRPAQQFGRANQMATDAGPGVYMPYTNITDIHEPWPSGNPEIEVHVFVRNGAGNFVDAQCAGEHQAFPFYFDQNNNSWSSSDDAAVELLPEDGMGTSAIEVSLWENDYTECTSGGGRPPIVTTGNRDQFTNWGSRILVSAGLENGVKVLRLANLGAPMVLDTASVVDHDDELGEAAAPSCWMSPNWRETFPLTMSDAGHPSNGQIELDFRFGQRQPACQQSLTVYLDGPNSGNPYTNVTITAAVSNYVLPIHYAWTVNGSPFCGDQNTCTATLGEGGSYTSFAVTVTDGSGSQASSSHAVYACQPHPVSDINSSMHSMSSAAPCY